MGPVAMVIGAVAAVGGTALSYNAQRKAANAQERQQKLNTQRSQRQAIREAQIRRAQAMSAASQLGGLGGSAVQGGVSSLGSQLGSGLGFSTQMSDLSSQISKYSSRAETFGAIGQLGMTVFKGMGGFDTLNKGPTKPPSQGSVYPNSNQIYNVGPQY